MQDCLGNTAVTLIRTLKTINLGHLSWPCIFPKVGFVRGAVNFGFLFCFFLPFGDLTFYYHSCVGLGKMQSCNGMQRFGWAMKWSLLSALTCGLGKAGAGRMKSEGKWLSEMECKGGFCRGVLQGLFLEWLKYFINFSYAIIAATVLSWSVEN